MLHDATWRNRGCRLVSSTGSQWSICQAAKLCQEVPSKPGCRVAGRFPLGRVPVEIILASGKGPVAGAGVKGEVGLGVAFCWWVPGRQKSGSHHSSKIET
jgi:hypothetical protein